MPASNPNPSGNALPKWASEPIVVAAIEASGLPIQSRVAAMLRPDFAVNEEWGFVDRNEGTLRTLDVHAERRDMGWIGGGEQPRVQPVVDLLIECKQSQAPHVFIESAVTDTRFPVVAGLPHDEVVMWTDDDISTYSWKIVGALGLETHPFLNQPAPYSRYVSRTRPTKNGAEAEFGSGEAYSQTVEPLMSSLTYFQQHVAPSPSQAYFDCHAVFAICVLASPMVVARVAGGGVAIELQPWVRLVREEAHPTAHRFERSQRSAIDYVHIDFLSTYVQDHLLPFARLFDERVLTLGSVIASGKGFVRGMMRLPQTNAFEVIRALQDPRRHRPAELAELGRGYEQRRAGRAHVGIAADEVRQVNTKRLHDRTHDWRVQHLQELLLLLPFSGVARHPQQQLVYGQLIVHGVEPTRAVATCSFVEKLTLY